MVSSQLINYDQAPADRRLSLEGVMGEADEGRPAVLLSGLRLDGRSRPARDLIRPTDEDLFR